MQGVPKASLEDISKDPLSYVSPEQKRKYTIRVVRRAAIFIAIGLTIFLIDLLLFSRGVNIAEGFNDSTSVNRRVSTPIAIWYGAMFICPIYGLYLLVTLRKHTSRLAKYELTTIMPELANIEKQRGEASAQHVSHVVNRVGSVLTMIFAATIVVLILIVVTIVILAVKS